MTLNPWGNPYPTSRKELDLREEMHRTLFGAPDEVAKGRLGLLRRMRRDNDNNPIRCACRDNITDEPDKDTVCRHCFGMGWYWDEYKITYFKNDVSFRKREGYYKEFEGDVFYVEYNITVCSEDYIITVRRDADGNVIIPVERDKYFKVLSADPFRSDIGRIEFWGIRAVEERKWSTWYGAQSRT